ncbi:MAG: Xaa-Pro peptidase family protein [Candidatus Bathyarchaeota archaeon]|nr:Xaa-Pro peptidase family protein [Candidatus Bathyarchaeota archaeon]
MDQLEAKIKTAIEECDCDAVLAFGVDNFNYLTRTVLPFAEHYPTRKAVALFPKDGAPVVVCPYDWSEAVMDQGWRGEVVVYDENEAMGDETIVKSLEQLLVSLGLDKKKIGIDATRVTKGLIDSVSKKLPGAQFEPVDPMINDLRIIKTPGEISFIEQVCKKTDRGIIYALMHLEGVVENPGYTIAEFTERIRVHVNENGASGVGLLNSAPGSDGQIYYTPQRGWIKNGDLLRMDISAHYMGYWTNIGRMAVTGRPTSEQESAYEDNLKLKKAALEMLKPEVTCNEVYAHVVRAAEKQAIGFWKEAGIGHGVGASHHEPPYLNLTCSTELKPGMVLALDIYTYGPRQELIHSKDIYVITEEGNRKLSWYRSWDKLYAVTGFRATH